MMDQSKPPIIVVKKNKKGHGGHHGGSWKVAYADFVTAMMAFFLLMWLMGNTTEGQRQAISDYFENPSAIAGPGGASNSMIELGGTADLAVNQELETEKNANLGDEGKEAEAEAETERDTQRLEALRRILERAIDKSQALKPFKDQMLLDLTPEGLRVQIVDKENRPMFDRGSAVLKRYTRKILKEIGRTISGVPNRISISGHTDASRYKFKRNYSNWELSADRANAARRALLEGGMDKSKVGRVVGLSSSVLFDKTNPYNPINRRVSIIVMNKATEQAMIQGESQQGITVQDLQVGEPVQGKPEAKKITR